MAVGDGDDEDHSAIKNVREVAGKTESLRDDSLYPEVDVALLDQNRRPIRGEGEGAFPRARSRRPVSHLASGRHQFSREPRITGITDARPGRAAAGASSNAEDVASPVRHAASSGK